MNSALNALAENLSKLHHVLGYDCPRKYAASGKNQAGGSNIFVASQPAVNSHIEMRG